jgi:hypothetical protein
MRNLLLISIHFICIQGFAQKIQSADDIYNATISEMNLLEDSSSSNLLLLDAAIKLVDKSMDLIWNDEVKKHNEFKKTVKGSWQKKERLIEENSDAIYAKAEVRKLPYFEKKYELLCLKLEHVGEHAKTKDKISTMSEIKSEASSHCFNNRNDHIILFFKLVPFSVEGVEASYDVLHYSEYNIENYTIQAEWFMGYVKLWGDTSAITEAQIPSNYYTDSDPTKTDDSFISLNILKYGSKLNWYKNDTWEAVDRSLLSAKGILEAVLPSEECNETILNLLIRNSRWLKNGKELELKYKAQLEGCK